MDIMLGHLGQGLWLILLLSLPAVLLAAGVGLIVGILQAVTQVQEQTISAAPKILFVFLLLIFGGPLMLDILKDYMVESVHLGMEVIPRAEAMAMPPKPRWAYGRQDASEFYKENPHYPTEDKIKTMMNQPNQNLGNIENGPRMRPIIQKPVPKPGIAEQIYLNRKAAGQLPTPPDKKGQ